MGGCQDELLDVGGWGGEGLMAVLSGDENRSLSAQYLNSCGLK